MVKIGEHRAELLALESPVKVDTIEAQNLAQPHKTSTDRIMAVLDRSAGKGLPKPGGAD